MWISHKFFKFSAGILLVLLIIFMLGKIDFFLDPFRVLVASIFTPILVSGIFYYILRPLVRLLEKIRVRRSIAIVLTFIIVLFLFSIISTYTGAIIIDQFKQFSNLIANFPDIEIAMQKTNTFINQWFEFIPLDKLQQKGTELTESILKNLSGFTLGLVTKVTNFGTIALMVPFILFYLLNDDEKFISSILSHLPRKYYSRGSKILADIDNALSSYIVGQMMVALSIGIFMFIGYLAIGMKYSLILSIFAMITALIPFFGAAIGIIPALLVSLTLDPSMIVKVLLIMIIVQQVEANLISPQIMGQKLHVHPVTVILLLMIGISLYGFVGLLLIVPTYAALKATVKNIYDMYMEEKQQGKYAK